MPTFLNPIMLFGTLLIGIPIALHLIMRQQPRLMVFPALQFIQQRRDANQRRLKLRHLLLLVLRCAGIFLLALALARPIFQSDNLPAGDAPIAAALVFDTGPRMAYRRQNQTRLDIAQENGQALVKNFPKESDIVVLDSTSPRVDFDIDRNTSILRMEQLQITPAAQPLVESIENAFAIVAKSDKAQKEVFVFTDLSVAAWNRKQLSRIKGLLEKQSDVSVHLFDVGVPDPSNRTLGELELSAQTVSTKSTIDINFDVLDAGGEGQSKHTVELYLLNDEGKSQRRDLETIDLDRNGGARVSMRLSIPQEVGIHHGYVKFARNDNLPIDDVRYFTVEAKPAWRVLIAAPQPARSYARLLRDALAPVEYRRRGLAQFDCEIVPINKLTQHELENYQAVWVLDPGPLSVEIWQRLSRYVNSGGGVAFAFGRNAKQGESFNTPEAQQLLPATLTRQWKVPDSDLRLAPRDLEHPVLSRFKSVATTVPWDLNPVSKFWQLGELGEAANVIIPFDNGRPALVEQSIGQGLVLMMTTPLSDALNDRRAWNHLLAPRRQAWPGLILVVEMTHYLIGNSRSIWNYRLGETAELRLHSEPAQDQFLLTSPSGDVSRVTIDPRERALNVSDTSVPGHYELRAGGTQGTRLGFSANLAAEATRLERVAEDQFDKALGSLAPPIVRDQDALQRSRKLVAGRGTWEGYSWVILIVVFVMAGEQLVSSLFYRRNSEQMAVHPAAEAA